MSGFTDNYAHIECPVCGTLAGTNEASMNIKIKHLEEMLEDQRRALTALNSLIGGPYSTTTENLTLVGRLQEEIDDMRTFIDKAFIAHPNLDLDI